MKTRNIIQVVLGVVSLGPLLFIGAGIGNELRLSRLRNEGVLVEGRILDGGALAQSRGRKTHYLQVEFERGSGGKEVKAFPVDRDDFVHANQAGKIPITYVPGDPGLSRVGSRFGYNRAPLFGAIGAFLLILIAAVVIHFLPKGARTAPRAIL